MLGYTPNKAPAPRAVKTVLTTFLVVDVFFTGSSVAAFVTTGSTVAVGSAIGSIV